MVDSGEETVHDPAVVVGGPGESLIDVATRNGLRVALIEHEGVAGECTYRACMPSGALLRPGEALDTLRRVPGARDAAEGQIDLAEALDEHGRDFT